MTPAVQHAWCDCPVRDGAPGRAADGWDSEGPRAGCLLGAAQALDAPAGRRTPAPAQGRRAHQNADARVHSLKSQRVSLPQRQGGGPVRTAGLHCLKPEIYLFGGLGKKPQDRIKVVSATGGIEGAEAVLDGNKGTAWTVSGSFPQELVLKLPENYLVTAIKYTHANKTDYLNQYS